NLVILDDIDASLTDVSWTLTAENAPLPSEVSGIGDINITGDLPAGTPLGGGTDPATRGRYRIVISAKVGQTAPPTLQNVARAQIDGKSPQSAVNTTIVYSADIAVTKSGPATIAAGEQIKYTIVAQNFGPANASDITISDIVDPLLTGINWTVTFEGSATSPTVTGSGDVSLVANLPAGAANKVIITVTGNIPAGATPQTLTNTATYSLPAGSLIQDFNPNNNSSTVNTELINNPTLEVQKAGPNVASSGDIIRYTVTVDNNGPSNALGVAIGDVVPSNITNVSWTSTTAGGATIAAGAKGTGTNTVAATADMPANSSVEFVITGTINPNFVGKLTNTAQATKAGGTPVISSPIETIVAKTATLRITKNAPATRNAGETLTYTIQVNNDGPSNLVGSNIADVVQGDLTNVTWATTVNGGATITAGATGTGNNVAISADLPVNSQILVQVTGNIRPDFVGTISNTATLTPSETGIAAVPSNTTNTVVTPRVDISVVKTAPTTALAGEAITYSVTVRNAGPSKAVGLSIEDVKPVELTSWTWTATPNGDAVITSGGTTGTGNVNLVADLGAANGDEIQINFTGVIASGFAGTLINTATATPTAGTGNAATSTANTTVTRNPVLTITKTGSATVTNGGTLSYQILVANTGTSDAVNAAINDVVDANLINVGWATTVQGAATVTPATATGAGNNVVLNATIPAGVGNTVTVTVTGTLNSTAS
ncbi:MAG: DUF11 domain-containing protein, partial [Sphingobacteriales bacterium]